VSRILNPYVRTIAATLALAAGLSGCSAGPSEKATRQGSGEAPAASPATSASAVSRAQTVQVDKTAWYAGLKLTFGAVTFDPEADPQLSAKVLVENLSNRDRQPDLPILFSTGDQQFDGRFQQSSVVGAGQQSRLDIGVRLEEAPAGLAGTSFILGRGTETQSVVPIGAGTLVANEPRAVLPAGPKIKHRDLNVWVKGCDLRADLAPDQDQAKRDHLVIACFLDVQYTGGSAAGHGWFESNLRLKLPDGTVLGPRTNTNEALYSADVVPDMYVAFEIPATTTGDFALQIVDVHAGEKPSASTIKNIPFTV
jgi:hypothetical protein